MALNSCLNQRHSAVVSAIVYTFCGTVCSLVRSVVRAPRNVQLYTTNERLDLEALIFANMYVDKICSLLIFIQNVNLFDLNLKVKDLVR